jgi:hypothetical protein
MVTTGMIRRAELRKHMRIRQQLKSITLTLIVLLMLAAYPVYLFAQSLAADPVFTELDGLDLPGWSAYAHEDAAEGSRWCIGECRVRSRTWLSERGPDETHEAYAHALLDDGWRLRIENCQQAADDSVITCWQRDEYLMVMHIRKPLCDAPPTREPVPGASPTATDPAQATGPPAEPACPAALVTMYISNAIDEPAAPAA